MIDPTWLIIGFFFVTLLFLVAVGAFMYDMKGTLKGVHNELKKQNRPLRRGEISIISGDLGTTDPTTTAVNLRALRQDSASRWEPVQPERTGEPVISGGTDLDLDATKAMPRVRP